MKKSRNSKTSKSGKPRRRVVPFWRSRRLRIVLMVLLVSLAGGESWWLWKSGWVQQTVERTKWTLIAASTELGFRVEEILVVGRRETTRKELLGAVRLVRGAPILAFDLEVAKKRLEALPWIKTASVGRMLPDTVMLNVVERRPLALWQHKGVFALIDTDGEVIMKENLDRFSDLLVVVGPDAPLHAAKLLQVLATEPQLMDWVEAAIRVGGRRWNLRLKNDIDVRLPEENTAKAWSRLAEYEKNHRVLERDVQILDLRLPDRLIVRKVPKPPRKKSGKRQET